MFAQIKTVVDILISGFKSVREFKSEAERESAVVNMLSFYYLLKDCVDEGEDLIVEAGSNPPAKLKALPVEEALAIAQRWNTVVIKQGERLFSLNNLLVGQEQLAIIDPDLETKLKAAIGHKMNRTRNLALIGAVLFFKGVLPRPDAEVLRAEAVGLLAGARAQGRINLEKVQEEVKNLRASLNIYRKHVLALISNDEIVKLSKTARRKTKIEDE
jgi:hypothetical protein